MPLRVDPYETLKYRILARAVVRGSSYDPKEPRCGLCDELLDAAAELLAEAYAENVGLEKALCRAVGETDRLRVKLEKG